METAQDLKDKKDLADSIRSQLNYISRITTTYKWKLLDLSKQGSLSSMKVASFESVRDMVHSVYQTERILQEAEECLISLQRLEIKDKVVEEYALVGCAD